MLQKVIKYTLLVASICPFSFVFYQIMHDQWSLIYDKYFPCTSPVVYSLGTFDKRFGLSEKDFVSSLQNAEAMWEKPIGKNLFSFQSDATSSVKVNLVYDYRQEATTKLHDLGIAVNDTRASYDELRVRYDTLQKSFNSEKVQYEKEVSDFKAQQQIYLNKVNSWNAKGGAPKDVYNQLRNEADNLETKLASIHSLENDINNKATQINSLIVVINRIAETLNLKVDALNTVGKSRGEEFTEGEYKSDASGQEIDIYEFSAKDKLTRVLAHELGHALGLDHVEDPKAVMYRLNQGTGDQLTNDDLLALKTYCHIK